MLWFSSCVPWVTISPWAWWCTSSNTQNTMRSTAISMTVMTMHLNKDNIWPAIVRLSLAVRYREPEEDKRAIIRVILGLSQMCVSLWSFLGFELVLLQSPHPSLFIPCVHYYRSKVWRQFVFKLLLIKINTFISLSFFVSIHQRILKKYHSFH